jgi:haloacetate dehalogenase
VCEDYRAAAGIDFETDTVDFNTGNKIKCPVLVLWGAKSHVEQHFKPREAWPQYAANIAGFVPLPAGHYPQEQAPDETCDALHKFFKE